MLHLEDEKIGKCTVKYSELNDTPSFSVENPYHFIYNNCFTVIFCQTFDEKGTSFYIVDRMR